MRLFAFAAGGVLSTAAVLIVGPRHVLPAPEVIDRRADEPTLRRLAEQNRQQADRIAELEEALLLGRQLGRDADRRRATDRTPDPLGPELIPAQHLPTTP